MGNVLKCLKDFSDWKQRTTRLLRVDCGMPVEGLVSLEYEDQALRTVSACMFPPIFKEGAGVLLLFL